MVDMRKPLRSRWRDAFPPKVHHLSGGDSVEVFAFLEVASE
jgi:hypothetical protein